MNSYTDLKSTVPLLTAGLLLFLLSISLGCKKEKDQDSVPVVSTKPVTEIRQLTAVCGGNITEDNGSDVTARGVCWSTSQNPGLNDNKTVNGSGTGSFQSTLTGLQPETSYYVRAYATNSNGTSFGNIVSFQTSATTMTDFDGNVYNVIQIGMQEWMKSNLKTTKFNDGTVISTVTDNTAWQNLTASGMCWYDNNALYGVTLGALYNWHAVNSGNLCPEGWHVPSDVEWTTLTDYLGGENVAGGKLKITGTSQWNAPNTGATNESGFSAYASGARNLYGNFDLIHENCFWWSSTEKDSNNAWYRSLGYNFESVLRLNNSKKSGYSVRCLKD